MTKLIAVCALMLLPSLASADWEFQRHDCHSPMDWLATNGETLVSIGEFVVPMVKPDGIEILGQKIGIVSNVLPWMDAPANLGWAGIITGAFRMFVALGGSPAGISNVFLHLACVELVNVDPVLTQVATQ